jgi:hypothetical protein
MSKHTDVRTLKGRQQQGTRSQIQMRDRAILAGAPPALKKTAIAANLAQASQLRRQGVSTGQGPNWAQIDAIFTSLGGGIIQYCESVKDNLNLARRAGKADTNFENLIATTAKDCEHFTVQMVELKNKHEGKEGPVTEEDYVLYQELAAQYQAIVQQFKVLAFQTGIEITAVMSSIITGQDERQNIENLVANALGESIMPGSSTNNEQPAPEPQQDASNADDGDAHTKTNA